MNSTFWNGRKVFLTGHTGFKGSWLSLWLAQSGAEVTGYAIAPMSSEDMFLTAEVEPTLKRSVEADVRDLKRLSNELADAQPEVIFHLAAQSLVRSSYDDPCGTFETNVMGTVNLLEAARSIESIRAIIIVTSDKCYDNKEWIFPYREVDPLGGADPYSASKACTEIATAAYRRSFFSSGGPKIATVRAGNVVGGGDWAKDRLIPDCIRSFSAERPVELRYPNAVRPWQHVLEPLSGYLKLAELLCGEKGEAFASSYNFGPSPENTANVGLVASMLANAWGPEASVRSEERSDNKKESVLLRLDSTKATTELGWKPMWDLKQTINLTADWYRAVHLGASARKLTLVQISAYETLMHERGVTS